VNGDLPNSQETIGIRGQHLLLVTEENIDAVYAQHQLIHEGTSDSGSELRRIAIGALTGAVVLVAASVVQKLRK
jgi:uncharacterized DUF497 family protein